MPRLRSLPHYSAGEDLGGQPCLRTLANRLVRGQSAANDALARGASVSCVKLKNTVGRGGGGLTLWPMCKPGQHFAVGECHVLLQLFSRRCDSGLQRDNIGIQLHALQRFNRAFTTQFWAARRMGGKNCLGSNAEGKLRSRRGKIPRSGMRPERSSMQLLIPRRQSRCDSSFSRIYRPSTPFQFGSV
jgi:hypothetical protein